MEIPDKLKPIEKYFVDLPKPLIGAKTIQILLAREVHDFSLLRTEGTGELNTAVTPESISSSNAVLRVAFLGSKQKAPETRMARSILDSAYLENGIVSDPCYHKDGLCLKCPRCILFGGVITVGAEKGQIRQIKHRIIYNSAFSLLPYDLIEMPITFNAINERTQSTDRALGTKYTVIPSTFFPSIVELREVTWKEFIFYVKTLIATHQYGAEGRIHGKMRNKVLGFIGGWESVITPLEFTLELYDRYVSTGSDFDIEHEILGEIMKKYFDMAAFKSKITVLDENETRDLLTVISDFEFTREFLLEMEKDVENFKKEQTVK